MVKVIRPDSNQKLLPKVISESFIIYLAFDSICHQYPRRNTCTEFWLPVFSKSNGIIFKTKIRI